jgi:hypothetical protein
MSFDSSPVDLLAAADLSLKLNRFGKHTSTGINVCTVAGERMDGVIGSKPKNLGEGLDFYIERMFPLVLGGTVAEGDQLTTDVNGAGVVATDGQYVGAIACEAGVAGQVIAAQHPLAGLLAPASAGSFVVANQANNQVIPAPFLYYTFAVPDAATSDIDIIVSRKIEVLDVICRKDAGAGAANTMQVKNGATAISNAIACDTDKTITRAGTIDVASNTIAAGGTLRLTATRAAGTRTALVTVVCAPRA